MTALLEKAIQETAALPEREQDFLASLLLDNLHDAQRWDAQFTASKDVLEELFDEAMEEYRAGRTHRCFRQMLLLPVRLGKNNA